MGVTQVVRGDDLVDSTPRQILVYRGLGSESRIPRYTHVPLVVGPDGKRLAKRHGDTRISHYRERGVSAGTVRAVLARWSGVELDRTETQLTPQQLLDRFDIARLPRDRIIMTDANAPHCPTHA
jgi:glutamyl-tRNA synthetase